MHISMLLREPVSCCLIVLSKNDSPKDLLARFITPRTLLNLSPPFGDIVLDEVALNIEVVLINARVAVIR